MATYTIESGTLHALIEAETIEDAELLCNRLFSFVAGFDYKKTQHEPFLKFSAVILNKTGRFKETVSGLLDTSVLLID